MAEEQRCLEGRWRAESPQVSGWRHGVRQGENKYFNNQAALCTLTIRLVEKEIQNAAVLVLIERISLTIAVEDLKTA